jgi:predicted TPR repeat methyltransferase
MAKTFDEILEGLDYRAPELLHTALADVLGEEKAELAVLDAGCGTGWCGPLFRPYAKKLVGVDLSAGMLRHASTRSEYDDLRQAELKTFLQDQILSFDLIIAADVLVYFGLLGGVLEAAHVAMRDGGWLAFTLEELRTDTSTGFLLGHSGRYVHTESYVRMCLEDAGFQDKRIAHDILRLEHKEPVLGMVVLARK